MKLAEYMLPMSALYLGANRSVINLILQKIRDNKLFALIMSLV
ncbi:hypothetical protein DSUL_50377 [Desulfovibrionales bacterium]